MFKFVILFAVVAAAAAIDVNPIATPLIGKLIPQPSLAPANTEHVGYVSGLTPIARQYIAVQSAYPAIYPGLYSAENIPLAYASNYVAYKAPLEASAYQISY